jgi:hypothetical protein
MTSESWSENEDCEAGILPEMSAFIEHQIVGKPLPTKWLNP